MEKEEREEIEKLVESKISSEVSKAKLEISESRLKLALWFGGAMLALGAVIIPIWMTGTSTQKVDKAIKNMEDRFARLAGTQLREPNVECLFKGDVFRGGTLTFVPYEIQEFLIKNVGDGPAKDVVLRLYVNTDELSGRVRGISGKWDGENVSDESGFARVFVNYNFAFALGTRLIPQDSYTFGILIDVNKEIRTDAMLKILFGQSEPRRIPFTLVVKKKE